MSFLGRQFRMRRLERRSGEQFGDSEATALKLLVIGKVQFVHTVIFGIARHQEAEVCFFTERNARLANPLRAFQHK